MYEAMRCKKLDEGDGWWMKKNKRVDVMRGQCPSALLSPWRTRPAVLFLSEHHEGHKVGSANKKEYEVTVKRCVSAQDRVSVICGIILQRCLDRKSFSILGTLNGRIMNNGAHREKSEWFFLG